MSDRDPDRADRAGPPARDDEAGRSAGDDGPRRRVLGLARGRLALASVLALVGLIGVIMWYRFDRASAPMSFHVPATTYHVCTGSDDDTCARIARDRDARVALTKEQYLRLSTNPRGVDEAVDWPGLCTGLRLRPGNLPSQPPSAPPSPRWQRQVPADCAGWILPGRDGTEPPGAVEVDAVRRSLDDAGFPGATVRIARGDDPAPRGAIVFAVPLDGACYVGYRRTLRGGGVAGVVGPVRGGGCLSA